MIDVLIIGGGPAGLTAAIYAARAGKTVTVCEKESLGGQITQAVQVENYPGTAGISGMALGDRLCTQAMDAGANIEFTAVLSLNRLSDGTFCAVTEDGPLEARTVIFAGGAKPRTLSLPGEDALLGSGISYCALCDGDFYRGQSVAVVGGGSTAVSDTLFLSDICREVTLIHRRTAFRSEDALLRELETRPNVRLLTPYTITQLRGEQQLEGLLLRHQETGESLALSVEGLFVALGRVPDLTLLEDLTALDEAGYAACGEDCCTGVPGLFVAGDCRHKSIRQLTTAVADGTVAAIAACDVLRTQA